MQSSIRCVALVGVGVLVALAGVQADTGTGLQVNLVAEKIVEELDANGDRVVKRVQPKTLLPGEEVVYTLTYRNEHDDVVTEVAITNPLDAALTYKQDSARGAYTSVVFSVDGGAQFAAPDSLTKRDADGTVRPAGPSDYTHIRWVRTRPLEVGEQGEVTFVAVVR